MNKTYRSVWNETLRTWVAAPETARGRGKTSKVKVGVIAAAGVVLPLLSSVSYAGQVVNCNTTNDDYETWTGSAGWVLMSAIGSKDTACVGVTGVHLANYADIFNTSSSFSSNVSVSIGGRGSGYSDYASATGQINFNATNGIKFGTNSTTGSTTTTTSGLATFNAGAAMSNTGITALAAGNVTASSTDAVNGSQLYGMDSSIAAALGGGASASGTSMSAPSYGLSSGTFTNVGSALSNLSGRMGDFVLYDSTAQSSVTFGGVGATTAVALHNVANGAVTSTSKDAVNGSQLYAESSSAAAALGGGTSVNADGSISNPVYVLNGSTFSNVGSALSNVSGSVGNPLVYDSSAKTSVTLGGTGASAPVALHHVANGALTASSTDAVNGAQLYATNTNVSNLAGSVTTLQGDITNINGKLADVVLYDSSSHNSVTLGGTGASAKVALHNVANGAVTSSSLDAVNGSQLYGLASSTASSLGGGSTVNTNGSISNPTYVVNGGTFSNVGGALSNLGGDVSTLNGKLADAVQYDSSSHNSVTLGGTGASTPVGLHNVANGALTASSTDAVNGAQLYATNTNVSNLAGSVTTLQGDITNINGKLADAVLYDTSAHTSVTLGGTGASTKVALHNVANGAVTSSSFDAVNGSQLYGLASSTASSLGGGSTVNANGSITNPSYKVGSNTYTDVGSALDAVVTAAGEAAADAVAYDSSAHSSVTLGGTGASKPVALHNVANGAVTSSSFDAVNGSQLYGLASSTADSLGGGSTVNGNGSISNPTYVVGGKTFNNVGDTVTNIDARVTNLAGDVTTLQGDVTNLQAQVADVVQYDSSAHNSVTLGGTGATTSTKVHNVADGALTASSTDAVNGAQLYATNTNVSNLAGSVTTLQGDVTNISGKVADVVLYDSSAHNSVTLGGTGASTVVALHNVANGLVNASSFDAVNGSQLYGLAISTADSLGGGSTVNANGSISTPTYVIGGKTYNDVGTALAGVEAESGNGADVVSYDTSAHDMLTLGDASSTTGVALHNVANGALTASSLDAVNGAQLYATNTNVSNLAGSVTTLQGDVTNLSGKVADVVLYDTSAHNSVTLGGTGASTPVALHNVANGLVTASSFDAVNGSQLYGLASSTASSLGGGSTVNPDGSISGPQYKVGDDTYGDAGSAIAAIVSVGTTGSANAVMYDSSARAAVTLGGAGTSTPVALHNVANGLVSASSFDAVNGSQLYGLASSTADSLGGGSTVNGNGSISNPTYVVGGKTFNNVGDTVTNIDARVTNLAGDITNMQGDVTNLQGEMANVVQYDTSAHDSVTLGGAGATQAVVIHNVAEGSAAGDMVNVSQMNDAFASVQNAATGAADPMFSADGDRNTEAAYAGTHAVAMGANASASPDNSVAAGAGAQANGNGAVALGAGAQANSADSVALGAGSVSDRGATVSVGAVGSERQITNVAAATTGTDMINVDQLNAAVQQASGQINTEVQQGVQQAKQYTDSQVGALRKEANSMGAAAMAATSLIPNARAEGKFQMAVAAGTYGGESAVAAGANWYVTKNLLLNANLTHSTGSAGSAGVSVGAVYGF